MSITGKTIVRKLCPPIIWQGLQSIKRGIAPNQNRSGDDQELDVYWTKEIEEELETWGEDNAWREIQFLFLNCRGKVLDIACGTGKVMEILKKFPELEVHGCDISDFLINKATERGLDPALLKVCDATTTGYQDKSFDYSYSIGSLEHFTEDGISAFLLEAKRITKRGSFHQIPVSRGDDEGWISPFQSYFNNTVDWWLPKFRSVFSEVIVLPSNWSDNRSIGMWFLCLCDPD